MEDDFNVIKNGNITVFYNGPERTAEEMQAENKQFVIYCAITAVMMTCGLTWLVSVLGPVMAGKSALMSVIAAFLLCLGAVIIMAIAITGALVATTGGFENNQRNDILDYFLVNKLNCAWFCGEIKTEIKREKSQMSELARIEDSICKKLGKALKVTYINDSTEDHPVKVVIALFFESKVASVTVLDADK